MPQLLQQAHGKHRVRFSKIRRDPNDRDRHEFIEASVDVLLDSEVAESYTDGDNRRIVATDTCKNTVYAMAKDDPVATIESFAIRLAEHFVAQYDHVNVAMVTVTESPWKRLLDSPHGFVRGSGGCPTASAIGSRDRPTKITAGVKELTVAKTTASGFANFHQDEFRTLPDTDDRILATQVEATWTYRTVPADYAIARANVIDAMLHRFLDHYSRSVQETLFKMGEAALAACAAINDVSLTMPNKHHILANLKPLGRNNANDVFIVTDEPYGFITATVGRDD